MTSTPGSDDGHMTFPQVGGACNDSASFPDLPNIQFLTNTTERVSALVLRPEQQVNNK